MMRQTGGFAMGATSTRSRSRPRAIRRASGPGLIPSWPPSGPIRRTSRARMRSLKRCSSRCGSRWGAAMTAHSCAMGLLPGRWMVWWLDAEVRGAPSEDVWFDILWSPWDPDARAVRGPRGRVGVAPTSPRFAAVRVSRVTDQTSPDGGADQGPETEPALDADAADRVADAEAAIDE